MQVKPFKIDEKNVQVNRHSYPFDNERNILTKPKGPQSKFLMKKFNQIRAQNQNNNAAQQRYSGPCFDTQE